MNSQLVQLSSQNPSLKLVGPAGIPQAGAPSQGKLLVRGPAQNPNGSPFVNRNPKLHGRDAGPGAGSDKSSLGGKSPRWQQRAQYAGGKLSSLAHVTTDAREMTQRVQDQP